LINREAVGEAENKWDEDGFRFETGSRDRFYEGDADAGARDLAKALDWEVSFASVRSFLEYNSHEHTLSAPLA